LLILLAGVVGAARLEAAGPDGVEQLNQAFAKAMQAGDIEGVMKLYAPDAVLFPPGEKAARGQEEIRYKWNAVLEANKVAEGSFKDAKYLSAPNLSTGWGNVLLRLEPKKPGKEPVTIQGRFSTTAEKRGGKWVYVFVGIGELDEILTLKHYSKTK
jgi:uncharacterized protein (TIGR02246 family)